MLVDHAIACAGTAEGVSNTPQIGSPQAYLQNRQQHITLHVFPSPSINRKRPSAFRNLFRLAIVAFHLSIGAAGEVDHDVAGGDVSRRAIECAKGNVLEIGVVDFEGDVVVPVKSEWRLL
jgi:hypothetical protein